MSVGSLINASDILNRVAAEVGVSPVVDPYASTDPVFTQLRYLLNTAGEELSELYPWGLLVKSHQIVTLAGDSGNYDLPADFGRMINQTGWEESNNTPLGGPLSAQDWTYLHGRDLQSTTLYISFRLAEGKFKIFPQNPPAGLDINFEYISTHWAKQADGTGIASVDLASDVPQFHKTLITRMLKVKFLESAGFDTTKAQQDLNQIFSLLTGSDKSAEIINVGGARSYPYLDINNIPDTGFGL